MAKRNQISRKLIKKAFCDSYWGEFFYDIDNKLRPHDMAIPDVADCIARYLFESRFPLIWRKPRNQFSPNIMINLLGKRGFEVKLHIKQDQSHNITAIKGFFFNISVRKDGGFYVALGGVSAWKAYTGGRMDKVADWMDSIAEKYVVIMDYVRAQYRLEQQRTLVDGLLTVAAQAYLPAGFRCEVWHERYLNDIKVTRRIIGILSDEGTIGDTVLEDENNLQDAIEKLLQNEEVHCYMKDNGLLLSDSGQ